MRVTIWDLDYYYAEEKVNCYNPDVMHISSYHKQCGDQVTFVLNEYDIRRPYDLYYIIKENKNTPNPPLDFFTNSKVRWWGDAVKVRVNWKMTPTMLGCRPDYLLYPEKNTAEERAELIRLFDNQAKLLPITQDYSNTFKRKDVILADKYIWQSSKKSLLKALDMVKEVKNLSFLEPIRLDIILDDKDIINKILELNLTRKSKMSFAPINYEMFDDALDFILKLKNKKVLTGPIIIKYDAEEHWQHFLSAYRDFENIKKAIVKGRINGVRVVSAALNRRLDTPYFHLFEEFNNWTTRRVHMSWLEYINWTHPKCNLAIPSTWDEGYRDLLRQTYKDKEFLLIKWKENTISENEIPWAILDKEFEYNI